MKRDKVSMRTVGYIRVSTDIQAKDPQQLETQAKKIRDACLEQGFDLLQIYEDVCSAASATSFSQRVGLSDACLSARNAGAILIVTEPTRLFRNVSVAREFFKNSDLKVFSVRDNRILGVKAFLSAVRRGEESALSIREGTKDALARGARQSNVDLSEVRKRASQASVRARKLKACEVVDRIAAVISEDQAFETLTHEAMADLLNRRGILSGSGQAWTRNGVRRHHIAAKDAVVLQRESEAEEDQEPLQQADIAPAATVPVHPEQTDAPQDAETLAEEEEMRALPTFGMFSA